MWGGCILWKKKFKVFLFSNDPSKLDIKKAINIKYENMPSSLYKYKTIDKHALELLKTDMIYLSNPHEFNDLFDSTSLLATKDLKNDYFRYNMLDNIYDKIKQKYGGSEEELKKLKLKKDDVLLHELAKLLIEKSDPNSTSEEREKFIKEEEENFKNGILDPGLKDKMYVACFSKTNKEKLMWSHYANDNKGFCIEYNLKELTINHFVNRFIFPVIYTDRVFALKEYLTNNKEFDDVLKKYMEGINLEEIGIDLSFPKKEDIIFNNMFPFYNALIKSKGWSYEQEWRFVFVINFSCQKMSLKLPKPKSVYLGTKISEKNFKEVLTICKKRNIDVYLMEPKSDEFVLEPKLVYNNI